MINVGDHHVNIEQDNVLFYVLQEAWTTIPGDFLNGKWYV